MPVLALSNRVVGGAAGRRYALVGVADFFRTGNDPDCRFYLGLVHTLSRPARVIGRVTPFRPVADR